MHKLNPFIDDVKRLLANFSPVDVSWITFGIAEGFIHCTYFFKYGHVSSLVRINLFNYDQSHSTSNSFNLVAIDPGTSYEMVVIFREQHNACVIRQLAPAIRRYRSVRHAQDRL